MESHCFVSALDEWEILTSESALQPGTSSRLQPRLRFVADRCCLLFNDISIDVESLTDEVIRAVHAPPSKQELSLVLSWLDANATRDGNDKPSEALEEGILEIHEKNPSGPERRRSPMQYRRLEALRQMAFHVLRSSSLDRIVQALEYMLACGCGGGGGN